MCVPFIARTKRVYYIPKVHSGNTVSSIYIQHKSRFGVTATSRNFNILLILNNIITHPRERIKMVGLMRNESTTMLRRNASKTNMVKTMSDEKHWYTLVKLDEEGVFSHVVSDDELRTLEELILSEPEQQSEPSLDTRSSDEFGDDSSGDTRMQQVSSYQKPGGPCDHCGAVGTFPSASIVAVYSFRARPHIRAHIAFSPTTTQTRYAYNQLTLNTLILHFSLRFAAVEKGAILKTNVVQRLRHEIPQNKHPWASSNPSCWTHRCRRPGAEETDIAAALAFSIESVKKGCYVPRLINVVGVLRRSRSVGALKL